MSQTLLILQNNNSTAESSRNAQMI